MTAMRTLRKLLFGETWVLPCGLAVAVAATLLARSALGGDWRHVGGFVLLVAVAAVVVVSVSRSAKPR